MIAFALRSACREDVPSYWLGSIVAATAAVAGALIPPGVSLTLYFSGAAILVVWLERRARSQLAMP